LVSTLHLLTIAGAALIGFKCARAAPDVRSDYGIVVAATALGILLKRSPPPASSTRFF